MIPIERIILIIEPKINARDHNAPSWRALGMSCRRAPSDKLTPSRVKHILRPLRNKRLTLLAYVSSRHPNRIATGRSMITATYGRSNRTRTKALHSGSYPTTTSVLDRTPPLALLPPPGQASHRDCLDNSFAYTYELARKVYSIRDAFKYIIKVGSDASPSPLGRQERELPSLTALCAAVIGGNMEAEFRGIVAARVSIEEELTDPVDDIYECIPSHHLRYVTFRQ